MTGGCPSGTQHFMWKLEPGGPPSSHPHHQWSPRKTCLASPPFSPGPRPATLYETGQSLICPFGGYTSTLRRNDAYDVTWRARSRVAATLLFTCLVCGRLGSRLYKGRGLPWVLTLGRHSVATPLPESRLCLRGLQLLRSSLVCPGPL